MARRRGDSNELDLCDNRGHDDGRSVFLVGVAGRHSGVQRVLPSVRGRLRVLLGRAVHVRRLHVRRLRGVRLGQGGLRVRADLCCKRRLLLRQVIDSGRTEAIR